MHLVLLGPQRFQRTVADSLQSLGVSGQIATVTAGWQEREPEDEELHVHLGGLGKNLSLYRRADEVFNEDPEFFKAHRERLDRLEQAEDIYRVRLDHAMQAAFDLKKRRGDPELIETELEDAIMAIRQLDEHHLGVVREIHQELYAKWPPHERELLLVHRTEVAEILDDSEALAIAGGHVGELLNCLHLFNIAPQLGNKPVVAWSAGAMAVCEKVVVFHERAFHGPKHAEVLDDGLGLCTGVIPLPHAKSRLRLEDRDRVSLFARRFAPSVCVPLDSGARLDYSEGGWTAPSGISRLQMDGEIELLGPSISLAGL